MSQERQGRTRSGKSAWLVVGIVLCVGGASAQYRAFRAQRTTVEREDTEEQAAARTSSTGSYASETTGEDSEGGASTVQATAGGGELVFERGRGDGGRVGPGSYTGTCGTPTLEDCQDPTYLDSACGAIQREIESVGTPGTCAYLIDQAMQGAADTATPGVVAHNLHPEGVARVIDGGALVAEENHYTADPLSYESQYVGVEYGNPVPRDAADIDSYSGGDVYEGWALTETFLSCAEFAYEAQYELNEYLRTFASGERSNLRAVEVAFGDVSDPASFGTRHLDDLEVHDIAGDVAMTLPYSRYPAVGDYRDAKNSFFWLPEHQHATEVLDPGPDLHASLRAVSTEGAAFMDLIDSARAEDAPGTAHYAENVYTGTLEYDHWWYMRALADGFDEPVDRGGAPIGSLHFNPEPADGTPFTEMDDYAVEEGGELTADQLLGRVPGLPMRRYLSAELDELYAVQERFEELARQWYDLNWEYVNSGWTPAQLSGEGVVRRGLIGHELTHVVQQRGGSGGSSGDPEPGGTYAAVGTDEPPTGAGSFTGIGPDGTPPSGEFEGGFTIGSNDETARRHGILAQMVALLERGADAGCLEPGVTPCDWSPAKLADRLLRSTAAERERNYLRCQSVINGVSLGSVQAAAGAGTNGLMMNLLGRTFDYAASDGEVACSITVDDALTPSDLQSLGSQRIACAEAVEAAEDALLLAEVRAQTDLFDEATGEVRSPGWHAGNREDIGNEYFGLEYGWDAGYGIDLSSGVCSAEASVGGGFDARAFVFGHSEPLIDIQARFDTQEENNEGELFRMEANVLGAPLFEPIVAEDGEGPQVHTWNATLEESRTVADISHTFRFVIVFIPVSIEAGAAGEVGFRASLGGRAHGFGHDECPRFDASGTFAPFVRATGFVEAAIDMGVAKAGVRGDLTIIEASLPITTNVGVVSNFQVANADCPGEFIPGLGCTTVTESDLDLNVDVNVALRLRTLDGSISAFAEAGWCPACKRASVNIVSWNGLQFDRSLYRENWSFRLDDIHRVLEAFQ